MVGSLSVKFPHLDITDRIDVDRGNGTVRRHEIYVTGSYDRSSLQVSYIQLPPDGLEPGPAEPRGNQRPGRHQCLAELAGLRRRPARPGHDQFLNTEYGLGYEDECMAISLAYRRKYTDDLIQGVPPSTSCDSALYPEDRGSARFSPSACSPRMFSP